MPDRQAEDRAVGEELVQVGVRVPGRLLGLVLGVDDGRRTTVDLPDDVWPERHLTGVVQVVMDLVLHSAAETSGDRLSQRDGDEPLEQP